MKAIKTKQNNYKWLDRKHEYKWDKDSPQKFQTALNSEKVKSIINNCKQRLEAGVIESSGKSYKKQQTYHWERKKLKIFQINSKKAQRNGLTASN